MKTSVKVGSSRKFQLSRALLVYGESSYLGYPSLHPFVTLHDVIHDQGKARLGAGRLLTTALLSSLVSELGQVLPVEILPECVLTRTAEMVVWWSPAKIRHMYFSDRAGDIGLRRLNGKQYPHPPLLFKASGGNLWIRALAENARPVARTKVCMAPYWNCYDNATVCTGTMEIPRTKSIAVISEWERSFFESAFSHAAGVTKHTLYPGGVLALWQFLQGKKLFPPEYLFPLKQTVEEFAGCNDTSYLPNNHV